VTVMDRLRPGARLIRSFAPIVCTDNPQNPPDVTCLLEPGAA